MASSSGSSLDGGKCTKKCDWGDSIPFHLSCLEKKADVQKCDQSTQEVEEHAEKKQRNVLKERQIVEVERHLSYFPTMKIPNQTALYKIQAFQKRQERKSGLLTNMCKCASGLVYRRGCAQCCLNFCNMCVKLLHSYEYHDYQDTEPFPLCDLHKTSLATHMRVGFEDNDHVSFACSECVDKREYVYEPLEPWYSLFLTTPIAWQEPLK